MQEQNYQGFRLSPQQKHLWLLQQEGSSCPFRAQCALLLEGELNRAALREALHMVVNRYEILRTTFPLLPEMNLPLQVISETSLLSYNELDLSSWETVEQEAKIDTLFWNQEGLSFNFEQGPLLYVCLLTLSAQKHMLFISLPALCSDAATLTILAQAIIHSYTATLGEEELTGDQVQYVDLSEWQNELLEAEETEIGRVYWREQQISALPQLKLPFDNQPFGQAEFDPRFLTVPITQNIATKIDALVQRYHTSASVFLLACWQVLLWRLTEQPDILSGVAYNGRKYEELKEAVGIFTKYLPFHSHLEEGARFSAILEQVNEATGEIYQWQEYFSLEQLQSNNPASFPTFFPASFDFFEYPSQFSARDVSVSIYKQYTCVDRFKVKLSCNRRGDSLITEFHYDSGVFQLEDIKRFARQFHTLLEGVINNPEAVISELEILDDIERERLLFELNSVNSDYPKDKCFHHLFEEQVERAPNSIAVVFENQQLTYAELNARANQVAHYLQKLGVGPEVPVGICIEPSLEMIVGLLGVLKAGGAYVPLDPLYPRERLAYIVQDAKITLVLTQMHLLPAIPEHAKIVCLDSRPEFLVQESEANLLGLITAKNLAYVIYTSGSTGRPKGVLIEHGSLVNFKAAMSAAIYMRHATAPLHATLNAQLTFDASVQQLVLLLDGHTLHVLPEWLRRDSYAFVSYIRHRAIDLLNCTPTQLQTLLTAGLLDASEHVPLLILVAGEAIPDSLWQHLAETDRVVFYNIYGPTECTVNATTCEVVTHVTQPSIGRPLANYQIYLLDRNLQPVPIGLPGELYIGGSGLARGYLNRPELTAEKFIPHPFSREELGVRLYKTGDLARYLPDGNIEFLGRIDHQVKIRGFRIELGEIETTLSQHPAVRETVVVAREDESNHKYLVAYIVSAQKSAPTPSVLRSFLQEKLPEYMIPAAFILLKALPLTPNGKLDRLALPSPDQSRPELGKAFVAPRTPQEEVLSAIWSQVLGIKLVGIDDNFFALGGDSIRSIQAQSRARERSLSFSLQQLFQHQTIRELTQVLNTEQLSSTEAPQSQAFSLISKEDYLRLPQDVEDAYPLSMLQAGVIFHSEYSPDSSVYQNLFSFHLRATLDFQALRQAIEELATRHAALRTSFDLVSYSEPLQLVHRTVNIPLQLSDIRQHTHTEQVKILAAFIKAEKSRHFDWSHAPFIRFYLHRRTDETFQITMTEHQAIFDGWSIASMLTELFNHYFALLGKIAHRVEPPPTVAFREFVALERKVLRSVEAEGYWNQLLDGSSFGTLPRWASSRQLANPQHHCALDVPISLEVAEGLKTLSHLAAVPIKSILLAAHLWVMSVLTGQLDVLTGLWANGRPEAVDGERVLGLFLNTIPFRLQLTGGSWTDLVRKVFEAEIKSLPFRRFPMAQLQRSRGGQPLFETAFNFTHFHVYENLQELHDVEVLEVDFFEQVNFTLLADFNMNPVTFEIQLKLNCNGLSEEQVHDIGEYYSMALVMIASTPSERYESQNLHSEQEQYQLLIEQNGIRTEHARNRWIHQIFEAQVERIPDAVAVVSETDRLTYQQLNQRANQLAHYLQSLGVGPEVLVGVCLEHSLELVVGLLGILKAGGASVPLDPAQSTEGLAFMLADAKVHVLLTQKRLDRKLPEHGAKVVYLDADQEFIELEDETNPSRETWAQNLAQIIYASDPAERLVGAMISHGSLVNAYMTWKELYQLHPVVISHLQIAGFSYDGFLGGSIRSLCSGGKLVLCPEELSVSSEKLYELMLREKVNCGEFAPIVLRNLIQYLEETEQSLDFVKILIVDSDGWPAGEYNKFLGFCSSETRLINFYGLTATTVGGPFFESVAENNSAGRHVLTRHLFGNTRIYLLDQHLRSVPIGVSGELYISGEGVERGYLNLSGLTAERFIPNPFSDEMGDRLYKTGVLACSQSDGKIELLGNIVQQVKIHGYRVDLREVETVLCQHSTVREAAVLAREDVPGDKGLVAYIIPAQKQVPTTNELRRYLRGQLPSYMVPTDFVILDALPLTSIGKVNRAALPVDDQLCSELENFVAPRTPEEKLLAEIWTQVLGVERVGIYDDFFELGGHSLLAIQLISRLRNAFQVDLPLRCLFEAPTVAGLIQSINAARPVGPSVRSARTEVSDLNAEVAPDSAIDPEIRQSMYLSARDEAEKPH